MTWHKFSISSQAITELRGVLCGLQRSKVPTPFDTINSETSIVGTDGVLSLLRNGSSENFLKIISTKFINLTIRASYVSI